VNVIFIWYKTRLITILIF